VVGLGDQKNRIGMLRKFPKVTDSVEFTNDPFVLG
jgi:hypothetical protein